MQTMNQNGSWAVALSLMVVGVFAVLPQTAVAADLTIDDSTAMEWVEFAKQAWTLVSTVGTIAGLIVGIIGYFAGADPKWLKYSFIITGFCAFGLAISMFVFEVSGSESMFNSGAPS